MEIEVLEALQVFLGNNIQHAFQLFDMIDDILRLINGAKAVFRENKRYLVFPGSVKIPHRIANVNRVFLLIARYDHPDVIGFGLARCTRALMIGK
jgi:hypothetical protein